MSQIFLPQLVLTFFIGIAYLIKKWGERFLHDEVPPDSPKTRHYACGHDMEPVYPRLRYHHFFRIAWMFGLLHLGGLTLANLIPSKNHLWIVLAFLLSLALCIWILGGDE
ncbi:MAG: hypothetical protein K8R40_13950 [Anaerolineaceae bacterium]|nr:hypothetical protein [Anaerolineaceae bacterium]